MPFSCPSPCCCRKERGGLPQSGPCWASQTLPPPCSQCCPVACPLVVLDPCQTLLCLHPLLISEIVSSLASFYPIQTAFKACLQPTSSRKPSLPATGLTLGRAGSVPGTGDTVPKLVSCWREGQLVGLEGSTSESPGANGCELGQKGARGVAGLEKKGQVGGSTAWEQDVGRAWGL